MAARNLSRKRRQVRSFMLIWTFITVLVGVATFFAIYIASPSFIVGNSAGSEFGLPTDEGQQVAAAGTEEGAPRRVTATSRPPTNTPAPTQTTAVTQAIVAQSATQTPTSEPTATNTPAPTATPLPVDTKGQFFLATQVQYSLDFNPDNQDGWMRLVQQLGMGWFKMQVRWENVEPERGVYDWGQLDLVMPSAQRFGMKVLLSVVTAPDWAREPGVNLEEHGPPANYDDYVNFVIALLQRYPGQVQAIEVWNEQNLDREWTSTKGLRAADYVELLRRTYIAVKEVDPGIIIISGALSPTGFNDGIGAWDDFVYMDQMIAAGLLNWADCIGAHHNGYNIPPTVTWDNIPETENTLNATFRGWWDTPHHSWSFRSTLEGYHTKVQVADGDQPICVTEFGWAVAEDLPGPVRQGFEFANDNTLEEQAEWVIEAIEWMEGTGWVWIASLWNLNYAPQAGYDPQNDNTAYSLIRPEFRFSPAYDALVQWSAARNSP